MDTTPITSDFSLDLIRDELAAARTRRVPDGSGHAGVGFHEGWIHGLANTKLFLWRHDKPKPEIDERGQFPFLSSAIHQLREQRGHHQLRQIMVNVLYPNGTLAAHRDGLPDHYRYHLPVQTNPGVHWWDEYNGTVIMREGTWYGPVPYCGVLHSVANHGATSRLHVVVDFEKDWDRV